MKNLVFVCNRLYGGGAERVLTSLASYFSQRNYNVSIIVRNFYQEEYEKSQLSESVKVYPLEKVSDFLLIFKLRKKIKELHPDIVVAFEYFFNICTSLASMGLKYKLIVSERNDPAIVGSGFLKDRLRNFAYRLCDTLVCQTEDAKNYFPEYIRQHSIVILNPLSKDFSSLQSHSRTKEIVNFCRLNQQKNLNLLLDAFLIFHKDHPQYTLHIYGNGPEKTNIENRIAQLKMDEFVQLSPSVPNIHETVKDAAMFVSSSDYEGLSNSMLEAMALGLPTICTDCPCGGARMVIQNGVNGILVPTGSVDQLVRAMTSVADNPDLAVSLSNNAIKINQELALNVIAHQWQNNF